MYLPVQLLYLNNFFKGNVGKPCGSKYENCTNTANNSTIPYLGIYVIDMGTIESPKYEYILIIQKSNLKTIQMSDT